MVLGYISINFKKKYHLFKYESGCVKIDRLEQVKPTLCTGARKRLVKHLGLEGSYIPQTCLEQMKLEKLLNEVVSQVR
ncbi:hypothetical protein HanLR1_Chr12g0452981 [Helianthus annuus]|nr:hypothetical protein HanHA89_Chr12g0476001 [Helianthus annuus]KAJ0675601.1 hypothetical protein HanLR1_Chr12g0452981 [Helianthus annuus]